MKPSSSGRRETQSRRLITKCANALFAALSTFFLFSGGALAAQGPGLGNVQFSSGEVFTQVSTPSVDDTTNILPPDYPGRKHFGVNVMTMLNGYMVGIFAPDSGQAPGGWIALDVSNPRSISLVKQIYEPDTSNANRTGDGLRTRDFREPHSFGLSENHLIAIQTGRGIEIWDWSNVNNPVQRSKLAISGVNFGDYNNVSWQLFWQAPYLYVARGNAGLTIVDTSDVDNPHVVKTVPTSQLGGFTVGPIFALGNELYLSSMNNRSGFSILNIDDPENPVLTKTLSSLPETYYASCWDGKRAFFGARSAGDKLRIYDTTTNPFTLLSDSESGFVNLYCNLQDNRLMLGNQDDISVLDVSDINNISSLGKGSLNATGSDTDHGQVFAFGNMVWVGNDHGSGSGLIAWQSDKDTTPPTLTRALPASEQSHVPVTSRIGISLSDSVLMESVNSNSFKVTKFGDNTPLSGTYSVNLGFVHFSPSQNLDTNQTYVVTLDGIEDFAGNAMPQQQYLFSTGNVQSHNLTISAPSSTEVGQSITLSASANAIGNGTLEYSWDFGDGSSPTAFSTQSAVSHTYTSPGHWQPVVTVRESNFSSSNTRRVTAYHPPTSTPPVTASTISQSGNQVYVVNEDNDTVTAISANSPFSKVWEAPVGDRPRTLDIAPNGHIWVTNQSDDSITVLTAQGSKVRDIDLPRASQPYGVAFAPDGSAAFVTLLASGKLLKLNPSTGAVQDEVVVGHSARGIAINSDSDTAYITRFISPQSHAEVVEVNLNGMSVGQVIQLAKDTSTIDGPDRSRGIPNYLNAITISPDGGKAWIPSNKANVDRGEFNEGSEDKALTFETTIRAIVSQIDLNTNQELTSAQLDIDNRAQPKAIQFSDLGDYAYIVIEGQNSVEIRDAYNLSRVNELADSGKAPVGLVKSGDHLFVHGFLSRSVVVYDVSNFESHLGDITRVAETTTVSNESLHPRVLAGKQIFHNAADARMTQDGYLSCASCHTGGDSDARVWDFTDRGEGLRNTIPLVGRTGLGHGRVHWTANFDEIHDFENDIRSAFGGRGFIDDSLFSDVEDPLGQPKMGLSEDLDNLSFYVTSLNQFPKSPYRPARGGMTKEALAGRELFKDKGCASCHSGGYLTDFQRHDVGTIQASSGQGISKPLAGVGFETPTLIGLWDSAPYYHNGQAATLDEALQIGSQHTVSDSAERAKIVAYLQQIEYGGPPILVPEPPAAPKYDYLSDLTETSSDNGWGPIEKDQSNGESGSGDGSPIRLAGKTYQKGLGVHAHSEITYDLSQKDYDQFTAAIGVDDEVGNRGSVTFEIYLDDVLSYQSGVLTGSSATQAVILPINDNHGELKLVVKDGGNGVGHDHADWADAKLREKVESPSIFGLYYGTVSGNINVSDVNPRTSVTIDLSETEDSIAGNTTEIYTGYIYDADGNISFREHIDDKTRLWIDGTLVLSSDYWNDAVSTGNLNLHPGWHTFELRISNGNGPSGPTSGIGFAYDPDGGTNWQHPEDPGDGSLFRTQQALTNPSRYVYLSDLSEASSTNGWGPIEKDRSNGEQGSADGNTLTIDGQTFAKGLGVHAESVVTYQFSAGTYNQFSTVIGVDDEVGNRGSVIFKVEIDGTQMFQSSTLTGGGSADQVTIAIPSTATSLTLKVTGAGDGIGHDHADWAAARLRLSN
ncbi:NPCBM/NEW2 domain-containing protein [Vibrio nigripulchritudo]|uniref:NPCBM/NEW2 domain-containing protein n=1 Tax=Vibrio nigripulchritudo TaxID=28173 RepID=UPI0003B17E85|nr:NPCBM/NEW2 domain-containing protein [Vibrio nigripulchritudo]CCN73079.1 conserved hypothetical protein [Vibrio nigripulchritudo SFn118]